MSHDHIVIKKQCIDLYFYSFFYLEFNTINDHRNFCGKIKKH